MPCVIQDWRTGEVLTLAYMNAEALAAHARDRRAAPVEPLARRAVAQGRDVGQHPGGARDPLRLRRRRAARARRARRAGLPHRRAHVLPPRRARAAGAARGAARRSSARSPRAPSRRPRAPTPRSCSPTRRSSARRSQEEAEEVARAAREETDERVAEEAADVLYHLAVLLRGRGLVARRRRGGAAWPSRAESELRLGVRARRSTRSARSPREHNLVPVRHTFLEDCETPVSAFLKLRGAGPGVPARVRRAGPARRPLVVHRLPPAPASCAGAWPTAATRTRSPPPRSQRQRQAPLPEPAAVRRRRGRLLRLRLRAHGRAAGRRRTRTRSGCPTWR